MPTRLFEFPEERKKPVRSIRESLDAQSVAVIGASRDQEKPGAQLLRVLKDVGYRGRIAGVNPQGGEVFGVPLYPSVKQVPFDVDLSVLLIPPRFVPAAVSDCISKGVKGIVISAEGFAEAGPEGKVYQDEVGALLRSSGVRGFGPNTLGIINTQTRLTTSYFTTEKMLRPGLIGLSAQSGIFVGALLRYLSSQEGLHLSKGIGLGNKVDVNESDALAFFADDDQTKIVGLYLEDVKDGRRFFDRLKETVSRKPVLMIKSARTQAGASASASHTSSLAVEDAVFDGSVRQAGAIRLKSIDELVSTLKGFTAMPLPRGGRLALVTYSGAQAIMSIDTMMEEGLTLAQFSSVAKERIGRVIATDSKRKNPIDIFPDWVAQGYEKTTSEIVKALLDDDEVDGILFISFADQHAEAHRPLIEAVKENPCKPFLVSLLGDGLDKDTNERFLDTNGIPCFNYPEQAVSVFGRMWRYAQFKARLAG